MHNTRKRNLERALCLSVDYILGRQHADGSWMDWELPPGQSSTWTTAYVGGKLTSLDTHHRDHVCCATDRASQWLTGKMFSDYGWGYNEQVDSDADSTALAIYFSHPRAEVSLTPATRASKPSNVKTEGLPHFEADPIWERGPHRILTSLLRPSWR